MAYDPYPEIKIRGNMVAYHGFEEIISKVQKETRDRNAKVTAIECYPGTDETVLLNQFIRKLHPDLIIHADDIFFSNEQVTEMIQHHLTDDRVFGVFSHHRLEDFIDPTKFSEIKKQMDENIGKKL